MRDWPAPSAAPGCARSPAPDQCAHLLGPLPGRDDSGHVLHRRVRAGDDGRRRSSDTRTRSAVPLSRPRRSGSGRIGPPISTCLPPTWTRSSSARSGAAKSSGFATARTSPSAPGSTRSPARSATASSGSSSRAGTTPRSPPTVSRRASTGSSRSSTRSSTRRPDTGAPLCEKRAEAPRIKQEASTGAAHCPPQYSTRRVLLAHASKGADASSARNLVVLKRRSEMSAANSAQMKASSKPTSAACSRDPA